MTKLILAIEEHWPVQPDCSWILLDKKGRILQEGKSNYKHWPNAAETEVILIGSQTLWLETNIPRGSVKELKSLVEYALEQRLLKDPDTQIITLTHRRSTSDTNPDIAGTIVVSRDRLYTIINQLKAIGRYPSNVFSELQNTPCPNDSWQLNIAEGGAILCQSRFSGTFIDSNLFDQLLDIKLNEAVRNDLKPSKIFCRYSPGINQFDFSQISSKFNIDVIVQDAYSWWNVDRKQSSNLLPKELSYKSAHSNLRKFYAPIALLFAAYSIWVLSTLIESMWLGNENKAIDQQIAQIFTNTFSNATSVSPTAQLKQALNIERSKHGLLKDDDALLLLSNTLEVLGSDNGGKIHKIEYSEGRLDLSIDGDLNSRSSAITHLLRQRGMYADTKQENKGIHLMVRVEFRE